MKNRWVILIACLSLVTGFITGAWAGVRFWQSFDEVALETRLMADAKTRVSVLSSLRNSNEDNAIVLLENLLDGDVILIYAVMETSNRRTELSETLTRVAKYRAQSGFRSTNSEVASLVQQALEHNMSGRGDR